MKILAIKSSGDRTGISLLLNDEINSFTMDHDRKDRPNWDVFLDYIGHKKIFNLSEIDLFAFENNQNSFTATRVTASYLKGIATALKKPLILIEDDAEDNLNVEELAIIAKEKFLSTEDADKRFDPKNVNPTFEEDTKFRKLNE